MSGLPSRWAGTVVGQCRSVGCCPWQANRLLLSDCKSWRTGCTVEAVQAAFGLSHIQAVAALDMQFRRLSKHTQSSMRSDVEQMQLERKRLSAS